MAKKKKMKTFRAQFKILFKFPAETRNRDRTEKNIREIVH